MKAGNIKDHEIDRTKERDEHLLYDTEAGYRSVRDRLTQIWQAEALRDKIARKRTGVAQLARLYGREKEGIDPMFISAMQRLWDLGTIDSSGRADSELRRLYHLIAKGHAPLSDADVIKLGAIPEAQLCLLMPWLAQQAGLAEAQDHVDLGETAPAIIKIEE